MCRRRGLEINAGKSKVIVLNGEDDCCEFSVDGLRLEHVLEPKYLGCVSHEPGTNEQEGRRKGWVCFL